MKAKEITITIPEADASVLRWINSQFDPSASFRHLVHEYIHASGYSDITCEDALETEETVVPAEKPEYPDLTSWSRQQKRNFIQARRDDLIAFFMSYQGQRSKNLVEPFARHFHVHADQKYIATLRSDMQRYQKRLGTSTQTASPSMAILGKPEKDVTLDDLPEYGKKLNEFTNRCLNRKHIRVKKDQLRWIDYRLTVCGYTETRKDYNLRYNCNLTADEFHQICRENNIVIRPKNKWTKRDVTLFNNLHRDEIIAFFAKDPDRRIDQTAVLEFNTTLNVEYDARQIHGLRYQTTRRNKTEAKVHANWEADGEKMLNKIKNDNTETSPSIPAPAYAYEK